MILLINNTQCLTEQKVSSLSRQYTEINLDFSERQSSKKGKNLSFYFDKDKKFTTLEKLPVLLN